MSQVLSCDTELFNQALLEVGGIENMSVVLGLSTNAIRRWIDRSEIPWQYTGDFLRMTGQDGYVDMTGDPVRDRDQFYTKRDVARDCVAAFKGVAKTIDVDLTRYHWVEPSAGCGWFYSELPSGRRTGIDIEPKGAYESSLQKHDFLLWTPPSRKKRYVVIGNPPFGLRGHLALQFINHAAEFADMVGFIVPQLFNSDGKGVPGKRVSPHLTRAYSAPLPPNSFETPTGESLDVHSLFQVWTKVNKEKIPAPERRKCDSYVSVFSVSDGGTPSSTRNKNKIGKCDLYLPSTCYSGMGVKSTFDELPHRRGYGVIIHKDKAKVKAILLSCDWTKKAFMSTNGALNLRRSLIIEPLIERGLYDK